MLVVLMLVLIIVTGIFVVGLFVGALASCLIFAVNYSRVSVVKNSFTLDEYGSKVQRSAEENQVLRVRGRQYWVLRLRGYLFLDRSLVWSPTSASASVARMRKMPSRSSRWCSISAM